MVKHALKMIILHHRQFRLQITCYPFLLATQGITKNDTRKRRKMDSLPWQWKLFATREMIQDNITFRRTGKA